MLSCSYGVSFISVRFIQAVVYVTRSIHSQENEEVINNVLKWHRNNNDGSRPFSVSPPTLPLLSSDLKSDKANGGSSATSSLKHNFLRMRQNSQMNGCFIAVLAREVTCFIDRASSGVEAALVKVDSFCCGFVALVTAPDLQPAVFIFDPIESGRSESLFAIGPSNLDFK